jgi:hypothetical protein
VLGAVRRYRALPGSAIFDRTATDKIAEKISVLRETPRDDATQKRYDVASVFLLWEVPMTTRNLTIRKFLLAAAFAAAGALHAAAEPAAPADEDCDDIMEELKELSDTVAKDKGSARTPQAACAVNGQLLGIAKASRAAAAECYDPGKQRDDTVAALDKLVKDMEGAIASCR